MRNYYTKHYINEMSRRQKKYLNEAMREYSADLNNETFYEGMTEEEAHDAIENIIQQISNRYQVKDVIFDDGGRFSDTDSWRI